MDIFYAVVMFHASGWKMSMRVNSIGACINPTIKIDLL